MTQLALGDFVFSLTDNSAYEKLSRNSKGGWVKQSLVNAKPIKHNTGQPLQTQTIKGRYFGAVGMANLDALRALQATREPLVMVDGIGQNLGRWTIEDINEQQSKVIDDGTAMTIDFTVMLEEFADEQS